MEYNVVSSYSSDEAVEDGMLVDTKGFIKIQPGKWLLTNAVYLAIEAIDSSRTMAQRIVPLMKDVVMLVNAVRAKNPEEYLITKGLEGNITNQTLWIGLNETGGWTVMFPSDY